MTYRERIDFILSYTDCDSMNVEEFNETVPEMTKLCDRADKYRWHDLRKNPEDLPKRGMVVLCYHADEMYTIKFREEISPYNETYPYTSVIAWREIEKFEVEE